MTKADTLQALVTAANIIAAALRELEQPVVFQAKCKVCENSTPHISCLVGNQPHGVSYVPYAVAGTTVFSPVQQKIRTCLVCGETFVRTFNCVKK